MNFKLFFLTLTLVWSASEAVKCFRCNQAVKTTDPNAVNPKSCIGGLFEKKEAVDCPMACMKWNTIFPDGDRKYERGCAEPWRTKDECGHMWVGGGFYSKCFCSEDYCNDATKLYTSRVAGLVTSIMMITAYS